MYVINFIFISLVARKVRGRGDIANHGKKRKEKKGIKKKRRKKDTSRQESSKEIK